MKIQHSTEPKIFSVVRSLDCKSLKNLIRKDPTIINEHRSVDGFTPLHTAIYTNSLAVVRELLISGASPNNISYTFCTPLDLALKTADTDPLIIKELIKKGGSLTDQDVEYYHQRRVEKYSEKMSIKDLTLGLITGKDKVIQVQITLSKPLNSMSSSYSHSGDVDGLEKLYSNTNKDKDTFSIATEIENKSFTVVQNLSGNYEELEYYT